ncbi:hypothetical protein EPI10_006573 [Gossypium australe]|uniref:Uncharacterized protein n=1 Tax=Gossypium australe TaxID=47621 RepID=A0A5B6WUH9_9ROSI|nr:hypothetical protein EPI10_006573 [Gossypium australe]
MANTDHKVVSLPKVASSSKDASSTKFVTMSFGNFTPPLPLIFTGENYHIWVVKRRHIFKRMTYRKWSSQTESHHCELI